MAVTRPRNRNIICRLTQDEYDRLQSAASDARSLSDFARERLLGAVALPAINQQLTELKQRVERIEEQMEQD
jgi:Tfp pilus assembly protein PilO